MMVQDNLKQDNLIEELNIRIINYNLGEDHAVINGESKLF